MAKGAKGYWINTAKITNPSLFSQYVEKVLPWLNSVDANVFAKDIEPVGKETTEDANFAVICEFPSKEAAISAYESNEYKEISKLREASTENGTFTIMEGMSEAEKLKKAMGK